MLAHQRGFASTSHLQAVRQSAALVAGGADLSGVRDAYPPLPTLVATVVPGGTLGLCVVSALFAGVALHTVWERLLDRDVPRWLVGLLLLPILAVPAVAYLASESLPGIATISLLAVAVQGFVRFARERSTEGGFVAGLALAAAFCFSPITVPYALALGASTVFLARERFREEPAAAPATVGVVLFPVTFAIAAWMFMQWRFSGTVFATLADAPAFLAFPGGAWASLGDAAATVGLGLLHSPLYLLMAVSMGVRRPLPLLGYLMPVAGSVLAVWIGLLFTQVSSTVLFTMLALISVPRRPRRGLVVALAVVALAQLALGWLWPPTSPGFTEWVAALRG